MKVEPNAPKTLRFSGHFRVLESREYSRRQEWFKSKVGIGLEETSLDVSFCAHTISERRVFVVPRDLFYNQSKQSINGEDGKIESGIASRHFDLLNHLTASASQS